MAREAGADRSCALGWGGSLVPACVQVDEGCGTQQSRHRQENIPAQQG